MLVKNTGMKYSRRIGNKTTILTSVTLLIIAGNLLASHLTFVPNQAWLYVTAFYWLWMLVTIRLLLGRTEVRDLFSKPKQPYWNLLPFIFIIPAFITVFLPYRSLIALDSLLLLQFFAVLINPVIEELYWRGLIDRAFGDNIWLSYLISVGGFALSHSLLLGINSISLGGLAGFIGTIVTGSVWWLCLRKTHSLLGNVITHALANVAGMTVYVLDNSIVM